MPLGDNAQTGTRVPGSRVDTEEGLRPDRLICLGPRRIHKSAPRSILPSPVPNLRFLHIDPRFNVIPVLFLFPILYDNK